MDQGLFGIRNRLAEEGISYFGISATTFYDNILRHGLPAGNRFGPHSRDLQQYNGQLPSYLIVNNFYLNYDLRRFGVPGGQITLNVNNTDVNWNGGSTNDLAFGQISYFQTLFNKMVEFKVGLLQNTVEFLGTQVGGSLANGVFGINASVPVENGENNSGFATPGVNVKVNLPSHLYTKLGVQRAVSPDGTGVERYQNPSSVQRAFSVPNTGVFLIDEVGYRVPALPGQPQTWVRAAANYTSSRYTEILTPTVRTTPNFGLYFLADRQLVQTAPKAGPGSAVRGLYGGVSINYGPAYIDRFTQYYEARLYGFGLIPWRPVDLVSLVVNRNVFSQDAIRLARSRKQLTHDNANTFTISYGARVLPGVNLNLGFGYTDNPTPVTYTRSTGSALNVLLNSVLFL